MPATAVPRHGHGIKWIAVKHISVVWASSQRGLDQSKVKEIREKFDPDWFGVITVCPAGANGTYHAIDGQTRIEAVRPWGEEQKVPCQVIEADGPERAAQIFYAMNTKRRPLKAIEKFMVGVTGGIEPEVSVFAILERCDYRVSSDHHDGQLGAVDACVTVYRKHGPETLEDCLVVIQSVWGMSAEAVTAAMLRGFALFLSRHGKQLQHDVFAEKVSKQWTPSRLLGAARSAREMDGGSLAANVARVLASTYNRGLRRGRLTE